MNFIKRFLGVMNFKISTLKSTLNHFIIRTLCKTISGDFPGGLMAKTTSSQCQGPGFNPWSGK